MQKLKDIAEGRRCSGTVDLSPHKKRLRLFFFPEQCSCSGTARETGAFPEQVDCNGVMVMSQRTGGKGYL